MRTSNKLFTPKSSILEKEVANQFELSEYIGKTLILSRKVFIRRLSLIALLLIFFSVLGQYYRYFYNEGAERYLTYMFNLDEETNFPTYFSTILLIFSSILTLLISSSKHKAKERYSVNWYIISLVLLLMSMDEILMFHEQVSAPIRTLLHTQGFFYFAWLVPATILIITFLIININLFFSLPPRFQKSFFIASLIYFIGAFLMEMVGGKFLSFYGQNNFGYAIITTIEESFELVGLIILLNSLLSYCKDELPNLSIKLE